MVVVEDEEAKLKREEEARRLAERQKCVLPLPPLYSPTYPPPSRERMQNALPVWHTHSTISGDQTGLGISHELLRQSRAPNSQSRTGTGAAGADGGASGEGVEQDGMSAPYVMRTDVFGVACADVSLTVWKIYPRTMLR